MHDAVIKRNTSSINKIVMFFFLIYMITYHIYSYRVESVFISDLFLVALVVLILLYVLIKSKIYVGSYFWFIVLFFLWSLLTCFWAPDKQLTLNKVVTLCQICFVSYLFYNFLDTREKVEQAIKMIMYSFIALAIYTVYIYGFSNLINGNLSERIGLEISQENVLGMSLSTGAVFCFFYAYYKSQKIYYIFFISLFILSSFTGSRKSLVILFIGLLLLIYMKDRSKNLFKTIGITFVIGIAIYYILQLPMFELVLNRMKTFFDLLLGEGEIDSSAIIRSNMISFGRELILKHPIIGYGFDSFRYYWVQTSGMYTYAHNNYIEMLINGGFISFVSYYGMYLYCLWHLLKLAKIYDKIATLLIVIIVIQLATDFAAISYYSKINYIYFSLYFAYIRKVSKK